MATKKAIAQLHAALEAAPDDAELLQRLAEALQRVGDTRGAADALARLAQRQLRDGYPLRAAALLKQVLRLDPEHVSAREALAALLAQLGLGPEAVEHYRFLLRHYTALQRAAEVLRVADALEALVEA